MTILYEVYNNLYVNLTNKCPCACTFCLRQTRDHMDESGSLWLEREPSVEEIKAEFQKFDMSKYAEVVFCGFGEPTERIDVIVEVADFIKKTYNMPTRINTNGLGNLVNGKDITPLLKGLIDTVSISLNTPNGTAKRIVALCRQAGMNLTPAGATYPYGLDPKDSNIRIAPSFPLPDELAIGTKLLCIAVRLATLEQL